MDLVERLQVRTALLAITRSALRNQGAPGVVDAARRYLAAVNLDKFSVTTHEAFRKALNYHTLMLRRKFPKGASKSWGGARKAMNLFLRDVVYCKPLCDNHRLSHIVSWLELPLDSNSYDGLADDLLDGQNMPDWPGVKNLHWRVNANIQEIATAIAESFDTCRVHLDIKYWRKGPINELGG
jgi:hypothetical protein